MKCDKNKIDDDDDDDDDDDNFFSQWLTSFSQFY